MFKETSPRVSQSDEVLPRDGKVSYILRQSCGDEDPTIDGNATWQIIRWQASQVTCSIKREHI